MYFHSPNDPAEASGSNTHQSFDHFHAPSLRNLGAPRWSHPPPSQSRPDRHTRPPFQPSQLPDLLPPASISTTQQQSQRQRIPTMMPQFSEARYETFAVLSPQVRVSTSDERNPIGGSALDPREATPYSPIPFGYNALDVGGEISGFTQYGNPFHHTDALSFHQLGYPRGVGDEDHRDLQPPDLISALSILPQTQPEPTASNGFYGAFAVPRRSSSRSSATTQARSSRVSHLREVPGEAASSTTQIASSSSPVRGGRGRKTAGASSASQRIRGGRGKQGCLTCRARRKVRLSQNFLSPLFPTVQSASLM